MHVAWIGEHRMQLERLDSVWECANPQRQDEAVDGLAAGIFFSPLYFVVELAQGIRPGQSAPSQRRDAQQGEPVYIKGSPETAAIAAPPNGIGRMPAGGGLQLGPCGLTRGGERENQIVEVAAAPANARTAFGAADDALP
jgi:hypothetical protein